MRVTGKEEGEKKKNREDGCMRRLLFSEGRGSMHLS